jgi:uncharacterized protein
MQKNPVVFRELATHDMDAATALFKAVFDWNSEFDERLGFNIISDITLAEESIAGGIFTPKRAKLPFVALDIRVENIYTKAELIKQQGGFIVDEPTETPGGTKICLFNEPSKVTFAMLEPKGSSK